MNGWWNDGATNLEYKEFSKQLIYNADVEVSVRQITKLKCIFFIILS